MDNGQISGINRRALFADGTLDYRDPEEPEAGDQVTLYFRTARDDAEEAFFIDALSGEKARMKKTRSDDCFDYYEHKITLGSEVLRYYFCAKRGLDCCFFSRRGTEESVPEKGAFCITPGFHVPQWAKGAVIYQIFPDRFCKGDSTNTVLSGEYSYLGCPASRIDDWGKLPSALDVGNFHGGDLKGVWDKLDYLEGLGIEAIYFNPLFTAPSNHKYDTQDYEHIDPHYGVIVKDEGNLLPANPSDSGWPSRYQVRSTDPANLSASNAFFARFVEEAHRRGMKVILDGVFNHCGSFHKWLDRGLVYADGNGRSQGAYASKDSPYSPFFKFSSQVWPDNGTYEKWWENETLPKLNYEASPELYDYIMQIGRKWVSPPYNADGWRLDVAADLGHSPEFNHKFWRDFRRQVKEANPDALILAEHYGDPGDWLAGDQWDAVMNYDAFMEPLSWFLTGMEKHSACFCEKLLGNGKQFFESMRLNMSNMQTPSLMTAMNQLSNHDHSRFLTRTNRTVGSIASLGAKRAEQGVNAAVYREAAMVLMTWPGAPTLYYGDETGVCGWTDPDSRRTYPWGREDKDLIEYHRQIIALHKHLPALRTGSIRPLAAGEQLIAYGRMRRSSRCIVALNNDEVSRDMLLPVWELGIKDSDALIQKMLTYDGGYSTQPQAYHARNGSLSLRLPPTSAILLNSES